MSWYLSRLASMEPAEILRRTRLATLLPLDWVQHKMGVTAPVPRWKSFSAVSYPISLHDCGPVIKHVRIFDLEFPADFDFDWHRDYRNNKELKQKFSGLLNIRGTDLVADIKYIWEVNRHQHLSALAYARNVNEHKDALAEAVRSWLDDNPYLIGINWTSSLELALRLISWAIFYPRLAQVVDIDINFRDRWLTSIYLHLSRIASRLSLYSSANNHLIGELVGLYVGASCFPFWSECADWRNIACRSLEREIVLQVSPDGVNREQAISYHLFTLELLLLAFVIGRNCGRPFSDVYAERLQAMLHFLDAVATPAGDLPCYGDSDDARGFVFAYGESALEVTTQLGGLLFDEPAWLRFRSAPTAAAQALVPDLLGSLSRSATISEPVHELFRDGGFACVRSNSGNIRLLMDFAPLGYTSIAAHGHADALSLWLAIGNEYFLIDAGTYAYHSHPEWRRYFRSTAAHNTARVDGFDQSRIAGRFMWSAKADSRLLRFQESAGNVIIEAEHDGYTHLDDPVVHRRTVTFDRKTGNFRLADSFSCASRHVIELFFHLHQDAEVSDIAQGKAEIVWRGSRIVFSSPDHSLGWDVICGSSVPKLGWCSRAFNRKQPISTLRLRAEINVPTVFVTQVDLQP